MSKENKQKQLVPELRFSEFDEDWDVMKLHKLGNLINGLTYSPKDVRDKGLLVLRSSNVRNGKIDLDDSVYVKPDIKGANKSEPNDILICVRNGSKRLIGKNALIPKGMPLSTHGAFMTVFRTITPFFIFQLFQTEAFQRQVKADLGATINSINGKNFLKYEFGIPPNRKEQQKIAATLTSLDNLIAAENEKLEALQVHKKGLLQQLFPAKGEKVPKLRFGEFSGEWEETTLGEIGSPLMCKRIFKDQTSTDSTNSVPFYKIGTFGKIADAYIPIELFKEFKSKFSYPNVGDILISASGTIGRLVVYDGADAYYQDSNIVWLGHDESSVLNSFLYYYYSTVNWQTSDGGVIKRLYNSNLKEMIVVYPKDKREQQKIAEVISSHDELITTQLDRLGALKEHKKGLMQQMFPNI